MKEYTEGAVALAGTINSTKQALADGKFDFPGDLSFFFDDISAWQAGAKDFTIKELATASNQQVMDSVEAVDMSLSAFSEEDRYDITGIYGGITSTIRLFSRKAYKKGQEDIIRRIQAGENIDAIVASL
jgi:methylaspartate ammonia-lyase